MLTWHSNPLVYREGGAIGSGLILFKKKEHKHCSISASVRDPYTELGSFTK